MGTRVVSGGKLGGCGFVFHGQLQILLGTD